MPNELIERTILSSELQEKVLLGGDLSKLSPQERLAYYNNVCLSLDLNPLTRPFEYIVLNGKLTLYARKDCTEQLRTKHNISVTILSREVVEGTYIVTARAQTANGRQDESIGAVPIANVTGNDRANAMMKAETKAKRRVTLSICGLGMLDETELETIKSARVPQNPEVVTVGLVPQIPEVRQPVGNRDFGAESLPAHLPVKTDKYTGEPLKPEEDGAGEAQSVPPSTQQASDAPAPKSAAEFARQQAASMPDDQYVDGIIGNFQPYQGTKAFQKGAKPGVFDVEDGQGGIVMQGVKYFDPELDLSSGLKRVFYKTDSYKGRTQYNAIRVESIE